MFRAHRWIGFFASLCALAFVAEVGLAEARTGELGRASASFEAYRDGPLDSAPAAMPELPRGGEELLGLSVLAAILFGLRISDLGRDCGPS